MKKSAKSLASSSSILLSNSGFDGFLLVMLLTKENSCFESFFTFQYFLGHGMLFVIYH